MREVPQLSLRGFTAWPGRGGDGAFLHRDGMSSCLFDMWRSTERSDLGGPYMPLNLTPLLGFAMVVFTSPLWCLEAVVAEWEGTSLEEVRKTTASVMSKKWYRA